MIRINGEVLTTGAIPEDVPIVMVNLLRYREKALYVAGEQGEVRSGRDVYFQSYVPAFTQVAASAESTKSIRPIFLGAAVGVLAGPAGEVWDDVALVEYPSLEAFRTVVESSIYRERAEPHRLAALEDWRLIATVRTDL